jgi:predicted lipoprotein
VKSLIAIAVLVASLAALRPWTVVPIHTAAARTFEPAGYIASIWESRVLPNAERNAIDLQALFIPQSADMKVGSSGGKRAVFVKGTAKVANVDRTSRVGLARLVLRGTTGGHAVAIQIGPVIRGTALRDALDFVRFTDFVNQLEFAAVAGALNDHVVSTVLDVTPALTSGVEVTFIGAIPLSASTQTLEIVPVKLTVARGTR